MANIGNGNKGRFSDRIKKMRFDRLNKKRKISSEDSEIMYKNFLKVIAVIPLVVIDNVFDKPTDVNKKKIVINGKTYVNKKDDISSFDEDKSNVKELTSNNYLNTDSKKIEYNQIRQESLQNEKQFLHKKKISLEKIKSIDVSSMKKRQNAYFKSVGFSDKKNIKDTNISFNNTIINDDKHVINTNNSFCVTTNSAKELEKKIINLIKKDLTKVVNELEILESELYILNEVNNDERTLDVCRKNIAEVKKILSKIEKLKQKYDYLKDSYEFEYLLEIDNNELVDNIIELKNKFDSNEIRATVDDYKLLEVYKYLYLEVDKIHDNAYKIEEEKKRKEDELKARDIDFNELKQKVYGVNKINDSYMFFVEQQNQFLKDLSDKIDKIDSHESVNYRLKGFGKYLFNSFKYLGLLAINPFKGIIPSIATQTIITRNAVNNMRNNLKWEENRKTIYEAIDYSSSLNVAIDDLDLTSNMIDDTLDNLIKMKIEYNNKFEKYQGDFLEYREVINKINSIQDMMISNKIKIEIMKNKTKEFKKENENKMILVRKLNERENNKNG